MPRVTADRIADRNNFEFDPIASCGYLYVGNSPTNYVDPSGLEGEQYGPPNPDGTWPGTGGPSSSSDDSNWNWYRTLHGLPIPPPPGFAQFFLNLDLSDADNKYSGQALEDAQTKIIVDNIGDPNAHDDIAALLHYSNTLCAKEWRDNCESYTTQFMSNYGAYNLHSRYYTAKDVVFYYHIGIPYTNFTLKHAAVQITLTNGAYFYVDDWWWGNNHGNDHIWRPGEPNPPPWVTPQP